MKNIRENIKGNLCNIWDNVEDQLQLKINRRNWIMPMENIWIIIGKKVVSTQIKINQDLKENLWK